MTLAGTVEAFNSQAQRTFKVSLAASIGVEPAAITLSVIAASVRVGATIRVVENATDVVESVQLLSSNITALSLAVGVTVESADSPTVDVKAVLAPSPPPPYELIGGGVACGAFLLALLVLASRCHLGIMPALGCTSLPPLCKPCFTPSFPRFRLASAL